MEYLDMLKAFARGEATEEDLMMCAIDWRMSELDILQELQKVGAQSRKSRLHKFYKGVKDEAETITLSSATRSKVEAGDVLIVGGHRYTVAFVYTFGKYDQCIGMELVTEYGNHIYGANISEYYGAEISKG